MAFAPMQKSIIEFTEFVLGVVQSVSEGEVEPKKAIPCNGETAQNEVHSAWGARIIDDLIGNHLRGVDHAKAVTT